MRIMLRLLVFLAAMPFAVVPMAAADAAPLQPAGKWVLDYQYTGCTAARAFGSEHYPTTLAIRPAPNGETYELLVSRAGNGPTYAEELEGTVDFGRGPIKAWLLRYHTVDKKQVLYMFRLPAADMTQARSATSVRFDVKDSMNVRVALTSMDALMSGLETCTADLKRFWNEGADKDGRILTPAKGDVRSVFSDSDFPQEALGRHQVGKAQFLRLIDEKGKIAACQVDETSGIPALDSMGCQVIMERAKFKPALDVKGQPMRSMYRTPEVIWRFG